MNKKELIKIIFNGLVHLSRTELSYMKQAIYLAGLINSLPNGEASNVSKNEKAKEFIGCTCKDEVKHGETSVMCCNECGKPVESFWCKL